MRLQPHLGTCGCCRCCRVQRSRSQTSLCPLQVLLEFPCELFSAVLAGRWAAGDAPFTPWMRGYWLRLAMAAAATTMVRLPWLCRTRPCCREFRCLPTLSPHSAAVWGVLEVLCDFQISMLKYEYSAIKLYRV